MTKQYYQVNLFFVFINKECMHLNILALCKQITDYCMWCLLQQNIHTASELNLLAE